MKNFKDYAVTIPGRYSVNMTIPALATVPQLIAWFNNNPAMVLTSNPGAILQVGTKNNAENLNEAQKDALMATVASSSVVGPVERYTHSIAELDDMFANTSCGAFNAKILFTPVNTNANAAPVLSIGGEDYTLCIKGAPITAKYLVAGSNYLLAIDISTKKANIVQLEITGSAAASAVNTRIDKLTKSIGNSRKTIIADVAFPRGTTLTLPITLEPQYIRLITNIHTDVALDTQLGMTDNLTAFREYIVELFSQAGNLKCRMIKDVDTSDHPFNVTVTSDSKLVVHSNHPDHNHILIISEPLI